MSRKGPDLDVRLRRGFFQHFGSKNVGNADLDQHLECAASKSWSNYTTTDASLNKINYEPDSCPGYSSADYKKLALYSN